MKTPMEHGTHDLETLQRRLEVLEAVCGEAYQFAGSVGAPERVLDNLAAAAAGKPIPHESFLPVSAEECDEVRDLHDRLEQVRKVVAG
jgi:hypothetical protein